MAIDLMYITKDKDVAKIAIDSGVDKIFVDMEYIDKDKRQKGLDTVQSHHTIDDVRNIRSVSPEGSLVVRVNPIHDATENYCGSVEEIDGVIEAGADVVMLPMFRTAKEAERFITCVGGRAKTMLLLETPESVQNLDDILKVGGIDSVHIGLNDLHLALGKKFMFELLADGTVDFIVDKMRKYNVRYGFGGVARIGYGLLPAEYVIAEHYRLGSSIAILSRSFCNANRIQDKNELSLLFKNGVSAIREFEKKALGFSRKAFAENHKKVQSLVEEIINGQN